MRTQPQQSPPRDHEGDFVEFFPAGTPAKGMFQCVSCEGFVVSSGVLEPCAACGEALWERTEWSPFRAARSSLANRIE